MLNETYLLGVMSMRRITFLFIVAVLCSLTCADDNWPRFRGPAATGVTEDDPRLPESWGRDENVAQCVRVSCVDSLDG